MAQQAKLLPAMPACLSEDSAHVPAFLLSSTVLGKAEAEGPRAGVPNVGVEVSLEPLSFWLQPGPALLIVSSGRVNQQLVDGCSILLFLFPHSNKSRNLF